jgi:hypothetical protein
MSRKRTQLRSRAQTEAREPGSEKCLSTNAFTRKRRLSKYSRAASATIVSTSSAGRRQCSPNRAACMTIKALSYPPRMSRALRLTPAAPC